MPLGAENIRSLSYERNIKNLVETTALPEDSYLDQDAEILEIFVEEIEEIFVELKDLLAQWAKQPNDQETLTTIRRHFHTLKGSGRMVGAKSAGELAWTVEDTLNRVISGSLTLSAQVQQFATAVANVFEYKLYPSFKHAQPMALDLRPLVLLGQQLQQNLSPEPALEELLQLASSLTSSDSITGLEFDTASTDEQVAVDAELAVADSVEEDPLAAETLAIFIEEAEEHLLTVDRFLAHDELKTQDYNGLIRALHTLRGSSSMAHIEQIFDASSKVENLFKTLLQDEIKSTSKETALLLQYAEFVRDYLHLLPQNDSAGMDRIYQTFNTAWQNYGFSLEDVDESVNPQGLVSKLIELNIDQLLDAEFEFDQRAQAEYPNISRP